METHSSDNNGFYILETELINFLFEDMRINMFAEEFFVLSVALPVNLSHQFLVKQTLSIFAKRSYIEFPDK